MLYQRKQGVVKPFGLGVWSMSTKFVLFGRRAGMDDLRLLD
jgi:hypothetical protein